MPQALYNNDAAYFHHWIVYINGLQVPAQNVSIAYGVWQIPEATIAFVPDPSLQRLGAEDRVQVQVFYLDHWIAEQPSYRLCFDGEIVTWGHTSVTGARMLTLSCVDYTAILTQLFFFFMGSYDDIAVGVSGAQLGVSGASVELAGYGALYPYSLFSQGLTEPAEGQSNATITRPIDFAYNIVRALIKAQQPNRPIPAVNFFTPWVKRTNYHRRWVATPYFDSDPGGSSSVGVFPILRAVQADQALGAVSRLASGVGTGGSLWDLLGEILRTMLMEVAMIPTPAIVQSDFSTLLPKGPPVGDPRFRFLTNYFVKPTMFFGLPPACNVFFPPQVNSFQYAENYATQATRMYFNEEAILSHLNANAATVGSGLGAMIQDSLCSAYPEEADIAARDAVQSRGQNGKDLLVYPEEFFKGPVIERRSMPRWFLFVLDAMNTAARPDVVPDAQEQADDGESGAGNTVIMVTAADNLSGAQSHFYTGNSADRNTTRIGQAVAPERWPLPPGVGDGHGSRYGAFNFAQPRPTTGTPTRSHKGHDISAPAGTPIYSVCPGVVAKVYMNGSPEGFALALRDAQGALHYYMHMRAAPLLHTGDSNVHPTGTLLGYVGSTGRSSGPHLHYQCITSTGHALNYTDLLLSLRSGGATPGVTTTAPPAAAPPPAATAENRAQAANSQATNAADSATISGDTARDLFRVYAKYEYYKERYAKRQGGVSMPFNPYPVPGFACAVFDRRSSACDVFGYVSSVRHNLSVAGGSTELSFSHGRTFQEMFALMQRTAALINGRQALSRGEVARAVNARPTGAAAPVANGTGVITSPNAPASIADPTATQSVSPGQYAATFDPGRADVQAEAAVDAELARYPIPEGAIAVAPAEPIAEIQGVVQNFERASEFYQGLFYQGTAVGADRLTVEQSARALSPRDSNSLPVSYLTSDEFNAIGQAAGGSAAPGSVPGTNNGPGNFNATGLERIESQTRFSNGIAAATRDAVDAAGSRVPTTTSIFAAADALRPASARSVFYYPDIIDMVTYDGAVVPIEIRGTDSTTRARLLRIIRDIRAGVASEVDLNLYRDATGNAELVQPAAGSAVPPDLDYALKAHEIQLRTEAPQTNVTGDVTIVPRPNARILFESHLAAQRYNARPIVSLEEYIDFLGIDGLREDPLEPADASRERNPQMTSVRFYKRIRRFRQGPPAVRPLANLTGTTFTTDVAAGGGIDVPDASATVAPEAPTPVQLALTALLEAAQAAATDASVQAATLNAQTIDTVSAYLLDPVTVRNVPDDVRGALYTAIQQYVPGSSLQVPEAQLRQLLAQEQARAAAQAEAIRQGRIAAQERANAAAPEADTDASKGTYPVDGIPANYPETRANWDAVLERYREIVLTRQAPLP